MGPSKSTRDDRNEPDRRALLRALASAGIGTAVFQRAVAAWAQDEGAVTPEMIRQAAWIAGLDLSDEDCEGAAGTVQTALQSCAAMRRVEIGYDVAPALYFCAQPLSRAPHGPAQRGEAHLAEAPHIMRPESNDELAFLPMTELAELLRRREVSSVELTELYLERAHRFDQTLKCVVTFTDHFAREQARQADREIARGDYRGPLHGIPWGAKDLIAYPGYPTTWGAPQFREQRLDTKATVAERLDQAGAVLVAKLSLGALAWGDKWFGGLTRNPWNVEQGSSGSSAGSASAAAAGLVAFALGSETLGSIVSPSRRCGCSSLRPTFGRVSRHGCMTLAWSMDKIGPIGRSVADCALVLAAIHGFDGRDPTSVDQPFAWPCPRELKTMRVGFIEPSEDGDDGLDSTLQVLREMGVELVPIQLPNNLPASAMTVILNTEAACVFDELTRTHNLEGLNRWPNAFRQGQFVPAVEYLRANRLRTMLIQEMKTLMSGIDAYVGGDDLAITNLTGHPTVVLPNGFDEANGAKSPRSITLTGKLFGESELLAIAHAYQQATDFHRQHPPSFMEQS